MSETLDARGDAEKMGSESSGNSEGEGKSLDLSGFDLPALPDFGDPTPSQKPQISQTEETEPDGFDPFAGSNASTSLDDPAPPKLPPEEASKPSPALQEQNDAPKGFGDWDLPELGKDVRNVTVMQRSVQDGLQQTASRAPYIGLAVLAGLTCMAGAAFAQRASVYAWLKPLPAKIEDAQLLPGERAQKRLLEGLQYASKDDWAKAIVALKDAGTLDPKLARAHRALGVAHARNGDAKASQDAYNSYLKLASDASDADALKAFLAEEKSKAEKEAESETAKSAKSDANKSNKKDPVKKNTAKRKSKKRRK